MEDDYMLTTYDNPINPFENFVGWWKYDTLVLGHDCCGTLAKEANTSEVFSEEVNERRITDAMDRIIEENPLIFRKVIPSDYMVPA